MNELAARSSRRWKEVHDCDWHHCAWLQTVFLAFGTPGITDVVKNGGSRGTGGVRGVMIGMVSATVCTTRAASTIATP